MFTAVAPFIGAIEFFTELWILLPAPLQSFISTALSCALGAAVVRTVND